MRGGTILVGSETWCRDVKQRAQGDWNANQAADFAERCPWGGRGFRRAR